MRLLHALNLVFVLFCTFTFAKETETPSPSCAALMVRVIRLTMNTFNGKPLLEGTEQREVKKVWQNQHISEAEKLSQTFEIYLTARLRGLPPSVEAHVKRLLAKPTLASEEKADLSGMYEAEGFSIGVAKLQGGDRELVRFLILAHEVEHAIQDALIDREKASAAIDEDSALSEKMSELLTQKWDRARFLMEKSAMLAEREYLTLIPGIEKRLGKILETPDFKQMDETSQEMLHAIHAGLKKQSPLDYLKENWKIHRYSLPAIRAQNFFKNMESEKIQRNILVKEAKNLLEKSYSQELKENDRLKFETIVVELRAKRNSLQRTKTQLESTMQELEVHLTSEMANGKPIEAFKTEIQSLQGRYDLLMNQLERTRVEDDKMEKALQRLSRRT